MVNPKEDQPPVLVVLSTQSEEAFPLKEWNKIEATLAETNRENAKVSDIIKVKSDQAALRTFFR